MVTRDMPYLITDVLPEAVAKNIFSQLHLVMEPLTGVNGNRYLTRTSDGNVLFITTTGNVHVPSWVIFLVTIPVFDLVMIR